MTPRDPTMSTVYGPPKIGKTTDLCYSFPRAIWIAAPGATAPMESVCGYAPTKAPVDVEELREVTAILTKIPQQRGKIDVDALIVDDLTLYVDRTIRSLAARGVGGKDPRQLWGAVRAALLEMRDAGRRAGIHVVFNTHEGPPKIVSGARVRGGPALPGAGAELVPAACDFVLRAQARVISPGETPIGWPVAYRCNVSDLDYVSGDRYNRTPDMAPMNLGEILRSAGFVIRRAVGLEWQEEIIAKAAEAIFANIEDAAAITKILHLTMEMASRRSTDERHSIWCQRDAYDRAVLRRAQAAHRRRLFG